MGCTDCTDCTDCIDCTYCTDRTHYTDRTSSLVTKKKKKGAIPLSIEDLSLLLKTKFKYFNIYWFDPNNSNDFDELKNNIDSVSVETGSTIDSIVEFFNNYSDFDEWIVISTGKLGNELISKIHNKKMIHAFLIYCQHPEYHVNWAKNFPKIKGICCKPVELYQKLLEINKGYEIPEFKYDEDIVKQMKNIYINMNEVKSENKSVEKYLKRDVNEVVENVKLFDNKYTKTLIKLKKYFIDEKKKFIEILKSVKIKMYKELFNLSNNERPTDDQYEMVYKFLNNLSLISFYFSKCPFDFECLSTSIIISQIGISKSTNDISKEFALAYKNTITISSQIKEGIFNLKNEMDKINEIMIFIFHILIKREGILNGSTKNYKLINLFKDADLMLKLFLYLFFVQISKKDKSKSFLFDKDFCNSLSPNSGFIFYITFNRINSFDEDEYVISKEDGLKVSENNEFKNVLVIGDNEIQKIVKNLENQLKINSINYLSFNDNIREKINNFKEQIEKDYWIHGFILILNEDDLLKYYTKLIVISAELSIYLDIFVYIKNPDNYLCNNSNYPSFLKIYVIRSPEDIINYLNGEALNLRGVLEYIEDIQEEYFEKVESLGIKLKPNPNIVINNGWALIDDFGENINKNTICRKIGILHVVNFPCFIFDVYRKHNAKKLFIDHYFKYCSCIYGHTLMDITVIKQIIYIYTKEEKKKTESFYSMVNDDLRSGDLKIICKYFEIISYMNKLIENDEILTYNGIVYRGTYWMPELINELRLGKRMINSSFWSSSKDYDIALEFLLNSQRNNTLVCITSKKSNIDIDKEELSAHPEEEEVLFIPYSVFEITKIEIKQIENKVVNVVSLIEVDEKNKCPNDEMIVIGDHQCF